MICRSVEVGLTDCAQPVDGDLERLHRGRIVQSDRLGVLFLSDFCGLRHSFIDLRVPLLHCPDAGIWVGFLVIPIPSLWAVIWRASTFT